MELLLFGIWMFVNACRGFERIYFLIFENKGGQVVNKELEKLLLWGLLQTLFCY